MNSFIKHSPFEANPFLHGGNKRTAQVNELLNQTNIIFKEADFSKYTPNSNNPFMLLKGLLYTKKPFLTIKNNYAIGRILKQFEDYIKKNKPSLFIWESTSSYNLILSKVLYDYGIPFFALPHNIESLVEGNHSPFSEIESPNWMFEELDYLRLSNKVFTISEEEQWLLCVNGLNTDYLPYHPAEALKNDLKQIREIKETRDFNKKDKLNILLLGTFYNKPTYDGYIELIESLKNQSNLTLNICGFGSELLKNKYIENNIKIHGTLGSIELKEMIINCDFGIIHQKPSSGALTRIPELLIAGLPLFVNNYAARSAPLNNGLQVYNTIQELLDLTTNFNNNRPTLIQRPKEEIHFVNQVLQYANLPSNL